MTTQTGDNRLSLLDVRSQQGTVTATVELDPGVFGVQPNVPLMHQVVTAQLAAARAGTQSTKTRAEVRGGGAKPYRQKGTGRARQGSTRAPHFAGGGVALGPKPRSYRQRTPRKMIQLALRCALSDRAAGGQVAVVESWDWEVPSTKDALAALGVLGLTGRVLVVLSNADERAYKSFRNLVGVDLVLAPELNAYDVLCSDWVVFTRGTLPGDSTWGEAPAAAAGTGTAAAETGGAGAAASPTGGRSTKAGREPEDGGAAGPATGSGGAVGAVAPTEAREATAEPETVAPADEAAAEASDEPEASAEDVDVTPASDADAAETTEEEPDE
jgi:large subunit ribosomal protein L4